MGVSEVVGEGLGGQIAFVMEFHRFQGNKSQIGTKTEPNSINSNLCLVSRLTTCAALLGSILGKSEHSVGPECTVRAKVNILWSPN